MTSLSDMPNQNRNSGLKSPASKAEPKFIQIFGLDSHLLALDSDGTIWCRPFENGRTPWSRVDSYDTMLTWPGDFV